MLTSCNIFRPCEGLKGGFRGLGFRGLGFRGALVHALTLTVNSEAP